MLEAETREETYGVTHGGTIMELSEGFTLEFRGQTYACENARSLGDKIAQLAARPRIAVVPPVVQFPQAPIFGPTMGWPALDPLAPDPPLVDLPLAQSHDIQRDNLMKLATSFVEGVVDSPEFERLLKKACPDADAEDISAALNMAEREAFGTPVATPDVVQAALDEDEEPGFAEELSDEAIGLTPTGQEDGDDSGNPVPLGAEEPGTRRPGDEERVWGDAIRGQLSVRPDRPEGDLPAGPRAG